jgi:hypothetical protein
VPRPRTAPGNTPPPVIHETEHVPPAPLAFAAEERLAGGQIPSAPRHSAAARPAWAARVFGLDARSLALFRMALGAIVGVDALLRTRDLALMFSPRGIFPTDLLRKWQGDPCCWSLATLSDEAWVGPAVLMLEGIAGGLLALGCFTRFATIAAWVAVVSVLRRTAPATNAGDAWLCCLLFWGMFLPLGAAWSWDSRRRGRTVPATAFGPGSVALVLQVAAVYLAAGLAKCNAAWLSGAAVAHALSVHDHGTALGDRLFAAGWLGRPLSWSVVAAELAAPVLLLGFPAVRGPLAAAFISFHAASCGLMTIGLFGYVGMAAWLPLVPAGFWDRARGNRPGGPESDGPPNRGRTTWAANCVCVAAGLVAIASLVHAIGPARDRLLPPPLAHLANLTCLHQEWAMFGTVERQEQWVYARGHLADGRVVDLLRAGRPLQTERPDGGFTTLPHHRWHKLLWNLPRPRYRVFAAPLAAALADEWNGRHPPDAQVVTVELHAARLGRSQGDDTLHDILLAAWPPRSRDGSGALERLLAPQDRAREDSAQDDASRAGGR